MQGVTLNQVTRLEYRLVQKDTLNQVTRLEYKLVQKDTLNQVTRLEYRLVQKDTLNQVTRLVRFRNGKRNKVNKMELFIEKALVPIKGNKGLFTSVN